jgi:Putative zinc-finger
MDGTAGGSPMNHDTAEAEAIVERYANGTLPAEETAGFEEHLVDCARCLDRLEWTERLRDDLRAHAAAPAVAGVRAARASRLPWALAAGLAAAALAGWVALQYRAGWERALTGAQAAADDWRTRYEQAQAASERPLVNVVELSLAATRGAQSAAPLAPTRGREWLLLSLEVEADPTFSAYAARVSGPDGRGRWSADGLAPRQSAVTLVLPAALAGPGEYEVVLDGVRADGPREPVGAYRFRVD